MKQKRSSRWPLILAAIVVLVLFWAASEHRLRPAYIGIAKFENKVKGIDGISAASLAKVKGDARRHSRLLRSGFGLWGMAKEAPEANFDDFVSIAEVVPDAILEIRYYTTYNFVGARIDGYRQPTALLTREAADSLRAVSDDVLAQGYRLKIFDAYRPQCAVDHFVRWAADVPELVWTSVAKSGGEKVFPVKEGTVLCQVLECIRVHNDGPCGVEHQHFMDEVVWHGGRYHAKRDAEGRPERRGRIRVYVSELKKRLGLGHEFTEIGIRFALR